MKNTEEDETEKKRLIDFIKKHDSSHPEIKNLESYSVTQLVIIKTEIEIRLKLK